MRNIHLNEKEIIAKSKVCLPLDDLNTLDEVKERVEELSPVVGMFKIGKELFTRFGPEAIKLVQSYGADVFYDSKYCDIPNTVREAAYAATQLGVTIFNVHALGGLEMMRAAVDGAREASGKYKIKMPKIIGVTILTSINQDIMNHELNIKGSIENQVLHLANLARAAGLDGVVCSAMDLSFIKDKMPNDFMFVTPGIKGPRTEAGADQKRVLTPGEAIKNGASILVIGRTITQQLTAEARLQAGYDILNDMARVM